MGKRGRLPSVKKISKEKGYFPLARCKWCLQRWRMVVKNDKGEIEKMRGCVDDCPFVKEAQK